jgi:hypothetical protein
MPIPISGGVESNHGAVCYLRGTTQLRPAVKLKPPWIHVIDSDFTHFTLLHHHPGVAFRHFNPLLPPRLETVPPRFPLSFGPLARSWSRGQRINSQSNVHKA